MEEEWKQLPDFSAYWFSRDGRVFSAICNSEMKGSLCSLGYMQYSLMNDSAKKVVLRHHLILARLFLPNPNNYPVVDHINRNKQDNRLENLRWVSKSTNALNSERIGRPKTIYGR